MGILQKAYEGDERVKNIRLRILILEFEKLEMKEKETVANYITKFGIL